MSFPVDVHGDFARRGEIRFRTVPASRPSDAECKSGGVLSYCQLELGESGDAIVVHLGKHSVTRERPDVFCGFSVEHGDT